MFWKLKTPTRDIQVVQYVGDNVHELKALIGDAEAKMNQSGKVGVKSTGRWVRVNVGDFVGISVSGAVRVMSEAFLHENYEPMDPNEDRGILQDPNDEKEDE